MTERLAGQIYASSGVSVPEFNGAPVLWRAVRALSGSRTISVWFQLYSVLTNCVATLYCLAKVVGHTCSLPLTLHPKITPLLPQLKQTDPKSHKGDNVAPELALIASAIVVLKMVYGLDGLERCALETSPPVKQALT